MYSRNEKLILWTPLKTIIKETGLDQMEIGISKKEMDNCINLNLTIRQT